MKRRIGLPAVEEKSIGVFKECDMDLLLGRSSLEAGSDGLPLSSGCDGSRQEPFSLKLPDTGPYITRKHDLRSSTTPCTPG